MFRRAKAREPKRTIAPEARALAPRSLSNDERTKEVSSYPHGNEFINMVVDSLSQSDKLVIIEVSLIHICQLLNKRAPKGNNHDIEFTQLLRVMKKIYNSYLLNEVACLGIFGDIAVDKKLGQLAEILDILLPLTNTRLAALFTHAEAVLKFHDQYDLWKIFFESLPTLTPLRECAFANFLDTYTTLRDNHILKEEHLNLLDKNKEYFAAIWVLDKCGIITLCNDTAVVTQSRIQLSEKIARLLMENNEMCSAICKYASTHRRHDLKIQDREIDEMSDELTGMLFSGIPELHSDIPKALRHFLFDKGSSLINSLRGNQVLTLTKK